MIALESGVVILPVGSLRVKYSFHTDEHAQGIFWLQVLGIAERPRLTSLFPKLPVRSPLHSCRATVRLNFGRCT